MKILVANLGSTSFKYRLFDMQSEQQMARGGVERIGAPLSRCFVEIGQQRRELECPVPHHGVAVQACLDQLTDPASGCLKSASEVTGIGFKAVHGGRLQGVFRVDEAVFQAMEEMKDVAPAHNPPYLAAMRQVATSIPSVPLVAAFETDFHATIPDSHRRYAIPHAWSEQLPIRRWGFHGASHRYIAWRMQTLAPQAKRIVSCHLGGSSSLCAIQDGKSVATTMGMSPQSGLPQNNRVGDFDPFAIPLIMNAFQLTLEQTLNQLANQGGLLGLSHGLSGDIRDLELAEAEGNADAKLALEVYVHDIRRQLGSMMVALGGLDALVFTGGIGENGKGIRQRICQGLEAFQIHLDSTKNQTQGAPERRLDADRGAAIWTVPTNEEWIVAQQTLAVLQKTP